MFSPDGNAMAYVSDISGRDEVYVQHRGGTELVSNDGWKRAVVVSRRQAVRGGPHQLDS